MAHIIQDDGILMVDAERVDLDNLCVIGVMDTDQLCTDLIDQILAAIYRADTTLLTADNTSITADYAL
jgi:hypothetical protein